MLRDTAREVAFFDRKIAAAQAALPEEIAAGRTLKEPAQRATAFGFAVQSSLGLLRRRYCRGDDLSELAASLPTVLSILEECDQAYRALPDYYTEAPIDLDGGTSHSNAYLLLALCAALAESTGVLKRLLGSLRKNDRLFDRIAARFVEGHSIAQTMSNQWSQKHWADLDAALDFESDRRVESVKKFLSGWYNKMKGLGWANSHKTGGYFGYFAYEVAAVVAAYDIDDSSFRDHKHYPADLVMFYRANIRHTRDAWRG